MSVDQHTACLVQQSVITILFMKQFVIDELRPADYEKLKCYLDDHFSAGIPAGIYWIPIALEVLSHIQSEHAECHPFYFAVELKPGRMAVELLVRTKSRMRCGCMAYATENQCNWLIRQIDTMFEQLGIQT